MTGRWTQRKTYAAVLLLAAASFGGGVYLERVRHRRNLAHTMEVLDRHRDAVAQSIQDTKDVVNQVNFDSDSDDEEDD